MDISKRSEDQHSRQKENRAQLRQQEHHTPRGGTRRGPPMEAAPGKGREAESSPACDGENLASSTRSITQLQ